MAARRAASSPVWLRGHADALGRRAIRRTGEDEAVEILRLADGLNAVPGCAARLADSAFALQGVEHPALPPVPEVEELADGTPVLASRYLAGERLADLLRRPDTALTTSAALYVLREIVGAVRTLHAVGLCHGAISPERILITPERRVVLLDPALGAVLARGASEAPERLWADAGIAVPTTPGLPPFSPLTDQLQIGLTGLAMFLGRPLGADEYPGGIADLVASAHETDLVGGQSPLGPMLREWIARVTLVSANGPFPSMDAAAGDLDILLSDDSGYVAAPLGLDVQPATLGPLSVDEMRAFGLVGGASPAGELDTHEPGLDGPSLDEPHVDAPVVSATFLGAQAADAPTVDATALDETVLDALHEDGPSTFGEPADAPLDEAGPFEHPVLDEPPAEAVAASVTRASAPSASALSLVPAPDPTANSERILELAHGLDAARARREAAAEGAEAAAAGAAAPAHEGRKSRSRWRAWSARAAVLVAGVAILLMAGVAAGTYYVTSGASRSAHLVIESIPHGATVVFEERTLGRTPVEVSLPRGGHVFEVRGQFSSQSLSVVVGGGERRTEQVTLPEAAPPGTLVITTEPVGTPVSVDGVPRGSAPLSLPVPPGRHVVSATNESGGARREVEVQTGAWVKVPLAVSGWIEVVSPVSVRTMVSGRMMPEGETRFAVGPGSHRVQFVNDEIGLRDSQDVVVEAGRTTQVTVAGASGVVEITSSATNTSVWIDGSLVGQAPRTETLALGRHEIRFVHTERGELRYDVFVKMGNSFLHGDFGRASSPAPSRTPARRR